jgi:hypothetical protein
MLTRLNKNGVLAFTISNFHTWFELGGVPLDITLNDIERWDRNVGVDIVPPCDIFGHVSKDSQYASTWIREQLCEYNRPVCVKLLQIKLASTSTPFTAWAVAGQIVDEFKYMMDRRPGRVGKQIGSRLFTHVE